MILGGIFNSCALTCGACCRHDYIILLDTSDAGQWEQLRAASRLLQSMRLPR